MAKALVSVDVRARARLLDALREQQNRRKAHGEISFAFCVNDDARNIGYVILNWDTFKSLRTFVDSPACHELIGEWPVEKVLEVLVLRDIADDYKE